MDATPDEVAAWAAYVPVEQVVPFLLLNLDPDALSTDGKLNLLLGLERMKAWTDALQARTLASLAGEPAVVPDKQFVREEIAAALHWSPSTAAGRINDAQTLVDALPGTLDLLAQGEISALHARAVVDTVERHLFDDATATTLERHVLGKAPERTVAELRRDLRRAAAGLDPRGVEAKHEDAVSRRRVCVQPDEDGMAWLHAYLPAPDAQAVWLALQALADTPTDKHTDKPTDETAGDCRSADQRRADAFVSVFTVVLTGQSTAHLTDLPSWQGRRPSVQVSVALSTLLGLDEQPGELDGYGPIPAALARRIAADPTGTWHRIVTDEQGRLVDYGRTRYRPPQDLIDHVTARDRTCRAPGCNRTARRSEIDHIHDWNHGGTTNAANLQPLCPRHHHTKHDAGWNVERLPDGTTRWTTPTRRQHDKPPHTYPVDHTRPELDESPPF